MIIATLGPKGTFSHEVTLKVFPNAKIMFTNTIREIFELVKSKKADFGVAPVENSSGGSIGETLDFLSEFEIKVFGEEFLPIHHNLAGLGRINDIKTLYLHPQTREQCSKFILENLSRAALVVTSSNGKSAEIVSKSKDISKGALVPLSSAKIYNLKIIKKNVEDNKSNVTRFFILSTVDNAKTRNAKTSILAKPSNDNPGNLNSLLSEFKKRKIKLVKIESRSSKGKIGFFVYHIDFIGNIKDPKINELLTSISKDFEIKVFGSYERKYQNRIITKNGHKKNS